MKSFRTLKVWEKAHQLSLMTYNLTKHFPKEELFGLTSQIRRAVVSIPANIAEGCCRSGNKDFARFIQISLGSASETEYLFFLAYELRYFEKKQFEILSENLIEIKKMLTNLLKKLKKDTEC